MQPQEIAWVVLLFVVSGIGVAGLTFAARFLRVKLGDANFVELERTVRTYIQAAEQMAKSGQLTNDARYDWVVTQIAARFPKLPKTTINAFVESAVYMLNMGATWMAPIIGEATEAEKQPLSASKKKGVV